MTQNWCTNLLHWLLNGPASYDLSSDTISPSRGCFSAATESNCLPASWRDIPRGRRWQILSAAANVRNDVKLQTWTRAVARRLGRSPRVSILSRKDIELYTNSMLLILFCVRSRTGPYFEVHGTARMQQTHVQENVKPQHAFALPHVDLKKTKTTPNSPIGQVSAQTINYRYSPNERMSKMTIN